MMRAFLLAALLTLSFVAAPVLAKDAVFLDGVLTLDSVKVGDENFEARLELVPGVSPETFIVVSGVAANPALEHAAVFSGTTLNIPNVLVNGTLRARATFILVGDNPLRFRLNTFSEIRTVALADAAQSVKPGSIVGVNYSGGILDAAKVKLFVGTTPLPASVIQNAIAATVPTGLTGSRTLRIELDGDRFEVPLAIQASVDIANPTGYVQGYVSNLVSEIQSLGLPANLLDVNGINSQLATLTEAEARMVALQIRENLQPLLEQINEFLESSSLPLQTGAGRVANILAYTSQDNCDRWMRNFARASVLTGAGVLAAAAGVPAGVPGAILTGIGLASTVIVAQAAVTNMKLIVNECGALSDATFTRHPLLKSEIVLTKAIEVYETRTAAFSIDEVLRIDQSIRNDYLSAASRLKSALTTASSIVQKLPFISNSAIASAVSGLAADIKTDDIRTITGEAHKFSIRAISDASVSGSTIATGAGVITLLFDKKNEELAEGKSVQFTIELYNSADGISITVPVILRGASMLEDLKRAALGNWKVTNLESGTTYDLVMLSDGKGYYKVPNSGTYCPNNPKPPVAGFCEYSMTWTISKLGDKYVLNDYGFWHPAYNDIAIVNRTALSLPLTGFDIISLSGTPGVRYVKQ
ncbi:MAG: hypothetical protein Q7W55_04770 [Pseudohongiella sp.]|nr:hypothetical protein [Pseudohongiella sp.]